MKMCISLLKTSLWKIFQVDCKQPLEREERCFNSFGRSHIDKMFPVMTAPRPIIPDLGC